MTREARELAPLSRSEWRIMNHCWRLGQCTARQVWEVSRETRKRDYQTIKTQLDRIAAKGYLTVEKLGPLCLYTPAVKRRRAVTKAVDEFFDVVLDRALEPLVVQLTHSAELSDEEQAQIRDILEDAARRRAVSGEEE